MKKQIAAVLILVLLVGMFTGCGKAKQPVQTEPPEEAGQQEPEAAADGAEPETASAEESIEVPAAQEAGAEWDPDFTFETVDTEGWEWSDRNFADAKLTMLNLWAYWCGPCVGEMPDLQKLGEEYAEQGFQIFGVSPQEYEHENVETLQRLGITYPSLRLTDSLNEAMKTDYIPATLFVDGNGHVLGELVIGSHSYEEWAAKIEGYLGEAE